jgi:hypothetical protein
MAGFALESFTSADRTGSGPCGNWQSNVAIGGRGPLLIGAPEQIADAMISWVEATGIDGFNLAYAVTPESFEDDTRPRGDRMVDDHRGMVAEHAIGEAVKEKPRPSPSGAPWQATANAALP